MRYAALCVTFLLLGLACAKDDVEQAREKLRKQQAESPPPGGGSTPVNPHSSLPGSEGAGAGGTASDQGAMAKETGTGSPMGSAAPSGGMDAGMGGPAVASDGAPIPLKVSGIGGAKELERELAKLKDTHAKQHFERAYRLTFTSDRSQRDYAGARDLLTSVLQADPKFAPAYRTLGYAQFNLGDMDGSMQNYEKAVEVDPSYGEAHYAIAFMMVMPGGDLDRGFEHYRKAMQVGVADERSIGERFYKDRLQKTP
jgi:hypothetical protein